MAAPSTFEFDVHVHPGSSRAAVGGRHDGRLVVRTTERPIDGRANDAVQRALATAFSVPRSAVTIVRGGSSRRKRIRIDGSDTAELAARLAALHEG